MAESRKPIPPNEMHPMGTFDPAEPAILHDRRSDKIVTWDGERHEHYRRNCQPKPDGTVEYDGMVLDGWGNVLGG